MPKKTSTPATKKKAPLKKSGTSASTVVSRSGIAKAEGKAAVVFSLDDAQELVASKKLKKAAESAETQSAPKKVVKKPAKTPQPVEVEEAPAEKRVLGAASLADILGFNPAEKKRSTDIEEESIPKQHLKYYKLLIELRRHVSDELDLHTADTLKHSSRDDAGDLSSYGNHDADAGTDTFDRDFALSLVSNEQEALNEIEEAIMRIKDDTYGVCEITGKPIPDARLTAVPFARYSVEGQAEYERNRRRKADRSSPVGLFGDAADAPKIASSDDEDE